MNSERGPCGSAKATDRFILSGGDDVFEPTFTFHGFRYVEVDGWPGELSSGALTAVVVLRSCSGSASSSAPTSLLNQLHRNVIWGTRGNFLDVPTDCPQRDERLGWTGDIAVFAPTPPTSSMLTTSCETGLTTSPPSSGQQGGSCPSSCQTS